ncbi:uncharacterized protein [Lepeophtheirus salmonis]|uniref:uncharacterized protein n=1 Tax=Lepeophtheirus salmonis TaxID=72036 RepID=UPI001AE590C9|nr:uncharacterized protein LOC121129681 [Lepeophtheirus salmonis]
MGFVHLTDGYVNVYTDGSHNPPRSGGIGVYFGDDNNNNVSERAQEPVDTSHCAELQAATKAINILKRHHETNVNLFTDSDVLNETRSKAGNQRWWDDYNAAKSGMNVRIHRVSRSDPSLHEAHILARKATR